MTIKLNFKNHQDRIDLEICNKTARKGKFQ